MNDDPRRHIPRTDELLALARTECTHDGALGQDYLKSIVTDVVAAARAGKLRPDEVKDHVISRVRAAQAYSLRPVINATGVIIHTNLGRAPLPPQAVQALADAAGYTDVELDMSTGKRSSQRGQGAIDALLRACPGAEDALVVNNGAAALLLACAALAPGKEVVISRGEMIEIGAGFRLPELIESADVRLHEVGATNRTHIHDYAKATSERTGAYLKVHPSNFLIEGFSSAVSTAELATLAAENSMALIVDLGSGLLVPDAVLPNEPDIHAQLAAGADVVIASGDKLLGGPQAGIVLGKAAAIAALRTHPLARALRIDKLRLNALEAAINVRSNAVQDYLHIPAEELRARSETVASAVRAQGITCDVIEHAGRVGGGGAPEFPLNGWAVSVPQEWAESMRTHRVLARVHEGRCLVDLRCVPPNQDEHVANIIVRAAAEA